MPSNAVKKDITPNKTTDHDFRLTGAINYAWLIRQDVRKNADISDVEAQKDFVLWWVLYGEKEYPNTALLPDEIIQTLFEPLAIFPQINGFGISRLLHHIYQIRTDIQSLYDISQVPGMIGFNQWFYLYGLREHDLTKYLNREIIETLNKPITDFVEPDSYSKLPALSPLMFFVWGLRKDIQDVFDLHDSYDRQRFLGWFFLQGVSDLGIEKLINGYWLDWLNEKIELDDSYLINRIDQLYWHFRDDVKNTFDLTTQDGKQGLEKWTEQALVDEAGAKWISKFSLAQKNKLGVNLIGYAFGELGIGEDVRMAAAACEKAGIPYTVINIPPGSSVRQEDTVLAGSITDQIDKLQFNTNIFCLTGFDTVHVFLEKGRQLFENRYNIGWWPWELPVWPEQWTEAFDLIDEVWAATTFTQAMYQKSTTKPVTKMPLAVSVDRLSDATRKEFSLPDNRFLFLYIFDFNSYLDRKNPHAAVRAFSQAFPESNKEVGLVMKTMNTKPDNPEWKAFQKMCEKDKRITVLEQTLDREKVLALINVCDAYVSLHRAEGFGRTPAEAMLLGKPVVATDFSGNTDFLNQQNGFPVKWRKKQVKVGEYPFITDKSNAYWAEPNISDAAEQMVAALKSTKNKDNYYKIKKYAQLQFSLSRVGKLMKNRLSQIS